MDKPKEACEICKKKYGGVFSNEHQCKRCLRSVCRQCCTKKKNMFTKVNTKIQEHRCCDICWPESQYITNYIKQNSLVFNTLCKEGKEWSELADIDLNQQNKLRSRPLKSKIDPIYFHDSWTQMTPSLRQLSGTLITKIPLSNIDSSLKSISQKLSTNSNIDLIVPLTIYIQCHCDQKTTTKIINYLSGISHSINEKQILENIEILCSKGQMPVDSKTTKNLLSFAKNTVKSLILSYFVNYFTIDIIHHIVVETLLSGDSQILELVASCVIYEFRNFILSDKYDEKIFKNLVWQSFGLKNLERSIKKLRKLAIKSKSQQNGEQPSPIKQQRSLASLKLSEFSRISQTSQSASKTEQQATSLSLESKPLVVEKTEQEKQKQSESKQLLSKISEAAEYLKKIQETDAKQNQEYMNIEDVESLEKYLDFVIQQNDKQLQEYEELQKMLEGIESRLGIQGTSST